MENLSRRSVSGITFLTTSFKKWYKDTSKKVVEVKIDGALVIANEEKDKISNQPEPAQKSGGIPVRIWIDIRMSNGLHLS